VVPSSHWLWVPNELASGARATVEFIEPGSSAVATAWPQERGVYLLDETAFRFPSYVAIGRFERSELLVAGGRLEIVTLSRVGSAKHRMIERWIREAALALATMEGRRFPAVRALVIVVPTKTGDDPVPFGSATRGGGASVALLLRENAEEKKLVRDWVAV